MEGLNQLTANVGAFLAIFSMATLMILSWVLVLRAFRENILWGLACLLFPIAAFLYVIRYWSETRRLAITYIVSFGALLLGVGMMSLAPELRSKILTGMKHQRERFEALREGAEPEAETQLSPAQKEEQERRDKRSREVAELNEKQKRAAELFVLVKNWHDELMSRQPAPDASEAEKARFMDEHRNYTSLLNEYKQASEEVKQGKAALMGPAKESLEVQESAPAPEEMAKPVPASQ